MIILVRKSVAASGLLLLTLTSSPSLAETCSDRSGLCLAACTEQNVSSGAQFGGTIKGCQTSCRSRHQNCLKTGVWVHMGSQTMGQRQQVDKR